MKRMKRAKPEAVEAATAPAGVSDEVVKTLENLANYYKQQRDEIEQMLIQTKVQAQMHATRAVQLQTELDMIRQCQAAADQPVTAEG